MHEGDIDLAQTPVVIWRWKAEGPIAGADNRVGAKEDAPARLVFVFDGDKSNLSLFDRASMEVAKHVGGQDLPYATLMYIWSTSAAPSSVIANPHTGRVQMIVVSGQPGDAGQWRSLHRNIVQDYERVFHEAPGRMRRGPLASVASKDSGTISRGSFLPTARPRCHRPAATIRDTDAHPIMSKSAFQFAAASAIACSTFPPCFENCSRWVPA
jgi:hypothetical protein